MTMDRSSTVKVQFANLHPAQEMIFQDKSRFRLLVAGRRFGKSKLAARIIVPLFLEGKSGWWTLPTKELAEEVAYDTMEQFLKPLKPHLPELVFTRSSLTIRYKNALFAAKSADNPTRLVGSGLDYVVVDEAGTTVESAWTESLRATLADKLGIAFLCGTPKGRNWFWKYYQMGQDPDVKDWASWRFPSSANPFLDPAEIEAARSELPEIMFKQEWEAEFLEDAGAVFRGVMDCIRKPPKTLDEPVVMGVDWGRQKDWTVAIILGKETKQMYDMVRFNRINWTLQRSKIKRLWDKWKPEMAVVETNSIGDVNIEALRTDGLRIKGFTTSLRTKAPLINSLIMAIEEQDIGLLDDKDLINELSSYEMTILPGGNTRYSAPPGSHDDCVMSLALALHGTFVRKAARVRRRVI